MMATKIYESGNITLIDGTELYITPLKIKYLREFMVKFIDTKNASGSEETIRALVECVRIAMKQYYPSIKTTEDVEDNLDLATMYKILDIAGDVKMKSNKEDSSMPSNNNPDAGGSSWEDIDLAKLEAEVFLLGIWKDYEDLETSLSMPELIATLNSKKDIEYQEKKFFAAIQGVDLDQDNNKSNAWEEMKARVASKTSGIDVVSGNDITAFQGIRAQESGFGLGMGLEYEKI